MKLMRTSIFVFSFFIVLISERVAMTNDQGNLVQVQLKNGNEIIELLTDISPNLVKKDFNERTGFMTSSGNFLRYEKDNIVRSKTQVDRYKEDNRIQGIARKLGIDTTLGAFAANPNLRAQQMTPGQFRLSGRFADFQKSLDKGEQTLENLNKIK